MDKLLLTIVVVLCCVAGGVASPMNYTADSSNGTSYNDSTSDYTSDSFYGTSYNDSTSGCAELTCPNGRCYYSTWICDGDNDCGDDSDEQNCNYTTDSFYGTSYNDSSSGCAELTCPNGRCYYSTWICDGDNDCGDDSDEQNCNYTTDSFYGTSYNDSSSGCSSYEFTCDDGNCLPHYSWECDGWDDCADNSDEQNCSCSSDEFTCYSGNCLPYHWECDGMNDCGDNSDEQNCNDTTDSFYGTSYDDSSSGCSSDQFTCDNGNCLSYLSWECDGMDDCGDNSDEQNCNYGYGYGPHYPYWSHYYDYYSGGCSIYEFSCNNGHCIPDHDTCNGCDDCGDNSDECPDMCGHNYPAYPGYHQYMHKKK